MRERTPPSPLLPGVASPAAGASGSISFGSCGGFSRTGAGEGGGRGTVFISARDLPGMHQGGGAVHVPPLT